MKPVKFIPALLILFTILQPADAGAESAAALVEKGNRAFAEKRWDEAGRSYDKAMEKAPDSARIYFNKGCALYMKGEFDAAADMFEHSALNSRQKSLEAKSRFNLGNTEYRNAVSKAASDPSAGLEGLEKSVTHYEKALELDPTLENAGVNLELARKTLQKLREQMEKQQQLAEERQKQQQKMQEELKDLADRQQRLADSSRQAGEEQPKSSDSRQMADEQAALREDTKSLEEKMAQSAGPDRQQDIEKARRKLQEAVNRQNEAEKNLEQSDMHSAAENQEQAAESLKEALAQMQKDSGQTPEQPREQPGDTREEAGGEQSGESVGHEEDKPSPPPDSASGTEDPRRILRDEQRHRRDREAVAGGGYPPVEKDW